MAEELKTKMKEYEEKLQIQAEATKATVKFAQQMKVDQEKGRRRFKGLSLQWKKS